MNVDHAVATSGYWAVFALVGAESLGVPLPGETALIAAGAYAGQTHHLGLAGLFAVAAAAAIMGDNIGYWIGAKGGYRLLRRYGDRVHLDARKLKIGRYLFDRHGVKVVFLGRFVSVLRTYAAFLAGANRMPWHRFLVANAAGGVLWAAVYAIASYEAGSTLRHISGTIDLAVGAVAATVVIAVVLALRRATRRFGDLAEAAYPGPLP